MLGTSHNDGQVVLVQVDETLDNQLTETLLLQYQKNPRHDKKVKSSLYCITGKMYAMVYMPVVNSYKLKG